jgi:hypothetical protein
MTITFVTEASILGEINVPNTAYQGGGIYNNGAMTLSGCIVSYNQASGMGNGIYNDFSGHLTIQSKTSVYGNNQGGAIWDLFNYGQVKISNDSYVGYIWSK